jgi:hypothetical protein
LARAFTPIVGDGDDLEIALLSAYTCSVSMPAVPCPSPNVQVTAVATESPFAFVTDAFECCCTLTEIGACR